MTTSSAAAVAALNEELASVQAGALLARLSELPHVTCVRTKPMKPANKLNHFGVSYKLRLPGEGLKDKRSAVTEDGGTRPTFVAAVQAAIDFVVAALREKGIEVAESGPVAEPPTTEELEWLAAWIDEQPEPDRIGIEQADAALRSRRATAAGAATAALLMERQLLDAKVRAAERASHRAASKNCCVIRRYSPFHETCETRPRAALQFCLAAAEATRIPQLRRSPLLPAETAPLSLR